MKNTNLYETYLSDDQYEAHILQRVVRKFDFLNFECEILGNSHQMAVRVFTASHDRTRDDLSE